MTRLAFLIATAGGTGYFPIAPGTVGSAVGIVIYLGSRTWPPAWQGVLLLTITIVGIWAAGVVARHLDRRDPGCVVIDEVAGQLVTLFLVDVGLVGASVGFLIFRILDIIKPWPARQMEAWHGGVGIVADDLMVGVYGWLLLSAVARLAPGLL